MESGEHQSERGLAIAAYHINGACEKVAIIHDVDVRELVFLIESFETAPDPTAFDLFSPIEYIRPLVYEDYICDWFELTVNVGGQITKGFPEAVYRQPIRFKAGIKNPPGRCWAGS
jgi:hypothetical protein